jgi:fluoroacetyl-CoA thioesterase
MNKPSSRTTAKRGKDTPSCPSCGFQVFNRRYAKCERCGAALPESIVYSAEELAALRERERKEELERQREQRAKKVKKPAQGALGKLIFGSKSEVNDLPSDSGDFAPSDGDGKVAAIDRAQESRAKGERMRTVPVGTRGSFTMVVAPEHLANRFKDASLPPVLSTPIMIMMMENAALEAIKPYFEPGESAVGTRVDVSHLAATPVGRRIVATAVVTGTSGRHIEFEVKAMDGNEEIGRGTHGRVVIDLKKFAERLAAKSINR